MFFRPFAFFAIALWALFDAGAAAGGGLAPHRAFYKMTLGRADPSSGVSSAQGVMMYRFIDSCEGWITENQSRLTFQFSEGSNVDTTWNFSSWESKDDRNYRFQVRQTENGEIVDDLRGGASLKDGEDGGAAHFTSPEDKGVDLPAGAMFPTAHVRALLAAAAGGAKMFTRTVFDGTSLDNPYVVSAFISETEGGNREKLGLEASPLWKMRIAFFPSESRGAEPEFEIGAVYGADGIADEIEQDFGDFSLILKIEKVELLPRPEC